MSGNALFFERFQHASAAYPHDPTRFLTNSCRPGNRSANTDGFELLSGEWVSVQLPELRRDPEQWAGWMTGGHNPCFRNREELDEFLADRLEKKQVYGKRVVS
jgi:hypothetical protein